MGHPQAFMPETHLKIPIVVIDMIRRSKTCGSVDSPCFSLYNINNSGKYITEKHNDQVTGKNP